MVESYVGEIRFFAGPYVPKDWALCDGQLMRIADFEALYSLIGTTYGGDGRVTFALPNLTGSLPVSAGQGPGLTNRPFALPYGENTVALNTPNLPGHTHPLMASNTVGNKTIPGYAVYAATEPDAGRTYIDATSSSTAIVDMSEQALSTTGSGAAMNNIMPSLNARYIIALKGLYPVREN